MASRSPVPDSVTFRNSDPDTERPVTLPFSSMSDIWQWPGNLDPASVASVPLMASSRTSSRNPKTLVCHDMKGGYIEDRFIQGVQTDTCYRFYYWSGIDVFVYFSHHFVTIPPPGWTNAAHQNGVPALGTVITEWDDGKKLCKEFLETEEKRQEFVSKLVSIATCYRFDGWLINIENEIPPEDMPQLVSFVKELAEAMNAEVDRSLVIWYDSVIESGELKWQNELNSLNGNFFDVCDGIFLNYTWKDENLVRSVEAAGTRISDVYVGVDVFGRGCKGDGGFNTIEALTDVRSHKLSAAIFAQGWVYEVKGKEDFVRNERHFWELLQPKLSSHKLSTLPIWSTFCQGSGARFHVNGAAVGRMPWTNLSLQSLQPDGPQPYVFPDSINAFTGGSCLKIDASAGPCGPAADKPTLCIPVFSTEIILDPDQTYFASYTIKYVPPCEVALELNCKCPDSSNSTSNIVLLGGGTQEYVDLTLHDRNAQNVVSQFNFPEDQLEIDLASCSKTEKSNEQHEDWCTRWYGIKPTEKMVIQAINMLVSTTPETDVTPVYLGSMRLFTQDDFSCPEVTNLTATDVTSSRLIETGSLVYEASLTLCWEYSGNVDFFVVYRSEDSQWRFVGATKLPAYRISKMTSNVPLHQFKVQAVFCAGMSKSLDLSPVVSVQLDPSNI